MSQMNDKVVLITGASSGIGRATAEAFAAKGARVAVAARREKELASLVSEIEGQWALTSDLPEAEWDRVLDINLKGTFLCLTLTI